MSRFRDPPDPVFHALNASIHFDRRLAPYDIRQSKAHVTMLAEAGILEAAEAAELRRGLDEVGSELERDAFEFQPADEDIHMAIERRLTEIVGPVGGKLHTARSRNDQVATDMALFVRDQATEARVRLLDLMRVLADLAERHADWAMPGYTHLQ